MKNVIIIGGGASGMAAAYACSEKHHVTLLEKNEKLGKKVYISGKGRCNLTNDSDMENHIQNAVSNASFLYSALYTFTKDDLMELMEANGCPLKTERGNRVFPVSDHASDVIRTFEKILRERDVEIRFRTKVLSLVVKEEKVTGVRTEKGTINADAVIVATGGLSYPLTGSDGDGYRFAKDCGMEVTKTYPALTSLNAAEAWCAELSGLALKNVAISLLQEEKKKPVYEDFGEMLFTHNGVSGPVILSASSYAAKTLAQETLTLKIDLKPALSEEKLDERILRDLEENKNKQLKNSLGGLLPQALIPVVIDQAGVDGDKKCNEFSRADRKALLSVLKGLKLTITGSGGFREAIVTQGGVSVKEIDSTTMESKKVKDLYFTGEVIDVDSLTGGYNLQIAFSTGVLAGRSIE